MSTNTPNVAPFPINPVQTGIALAYKNPSLIADMVLPRVPVGTKEFKYQKYEKSERFTLPSTKVGRKGVPNEMEFGATEEAAFANDYGLDSVIPNDDITQAAAGGTNYNPVNHTTEVLTDLILLDREKRVSDLVFSVDSYDAANKVDVSDTSTDQWSDYVNSEPREQILEALDKPIMRPNLFILGQNVWTKLRQHPQIVSSILGNNGQQGTITRQQLAALLEVEEVLVGQGWINIAKPGQSPNFVRVWGNHASLIYRNRMANTQSGATFGFTAQYQDRIAGQMPEPKVGLRGGQRVRVGESVKELVIAKDLGYFFENAIAS